MALMESATSSEARAVWFPNAYQGAFVSKRLAPASYTLLCLISVGYHLVLCIAVTFCC